MISDFGHSQFSANNLRTETISLSCLTPEQAGEVISPYVRSHGSTYYVGPPGVAAITVRATPSELSQVRTLLRNFDNSSNASCHADMAASFQQLQRQLQELQKLQPVLSGIKPSPTKKKPDNLTDK
jgi:hypothetical protein